MIDIEYNWKVKQSPIVVKIPGNIARKIIGSKRYKKDRDASKSIMFRWLNNQ